MKSKGTLYLESTEVPSAKSIGEITAILVQKGAGTIRTIYEGGKPIGLEWSMILYDRPVFFRMPVRVEPVYQILKKRAGGYVSSQREQSLREQADRISWRQMLAWVKLQMALIELGMVEYAQVFLPYVTGENGMTMWDAAKATQFKAIEGPKQ